MRPRQTVSLPSADSSPLMFIVEGPLKPFRNIVTTLLACLGRSHGRRPRTNAGPTQKENRRRRRNALRSCRISKRRGPKSAATFIEGNSCHSRKIVSLSIARQIRRPDIGPFRFCANVDKNRRFCPFPIGHTRQLRTHPQRIRSKIESSWPLLPQPALWLFSYFVNVDRIKNANNMLQKRISYVQAPSIVPTNTNSWRRIVILNLVESRLYNQFPTAAAPLFRFKEYRMSALAEQPGV